jgi:hypothetical protein
MKTQFTNEQINEVMEQRGCTRKAALRFLNRNRADRPKGKAPARAKDFKSAAANDKNTEFANPVDAPIVVDAPASGYVKGNRTRAANRKAKSVAAPAPTMTPEERGKARAEGLRLFTLAGRPKKSDFIKVYGKRGHLMTWTQRAEAGIPAEKFQAALRKAAR